MEIQSSHAYQRLSSTNSKIKKKYITTIVLYLISCVSIILFIINTINFTNKCDTLLLNYHVPYNFTKNCSDYECNMIYWSDPFTGNLQDILYTVGDIRNNIITFSCFKSAVFLASTIYFIVYIKSLSNGIILEDELLQCNLSKCKIKYLPGSHSAYKLALSFASIIFTIMIMFIHFIIIYNKQICSFGNFPYACASPIYDKCNNNYIPIVSDNSQYYVPDNCSHCVYSSNVQALYGRGDIYCLNIIPHSGYDTYESVMSMQKNDYYVITNVIISTNTIDAFIVFLHSFYINVVN